MNLEVLSNQDKLEHKNLTAFTDLVARSVVSVNPQQS